MTLHSHQPLPHQPSPRHGGEGGEVRPLACSRCHHTEVRPHTQGAWAPGECSVKTPPCCLGHEPSPERPVAAASPWPPAPGVAAAGLRRVALRRAVQTWAGVAPGPELVGRCPRSPALCPAGGAGGAAPGEGSRPVHGPILLGALCPHPQLTSQLKALRPLWVPRSEHCPTDLRVPVASCTSFCANVAFPGALPALPQMSDPLPGTFLHGISVTT